MRAFRILIPTVIAVAALALMGAPAVAFHDGGVAHCNGCHTMHASPDNPADTPGGNQFLLKESNSTDTCLRCHATRLGNVWGTSVTAPGDNYGGGQFVFLLEDNLNDGHAGSDPTRFIPGHQAGHNVISLDNGSAIDPVNSLSPGGGYLAAFMHCTSCHDPHGQGGHFRLLYGSPYGSKAMGYTFPYPVPAPEGVGLAVFGAPEANNNHSAYNNGMSEWCGNCHGDYHNTAYPTVLKHPSGATLSGTVSANYGIYNGSGHYDGDPLTSYLALVPFEDAAVTTTSTDGPSTTSKVMCLSCHRAHASSGPNAGRWDFNITLWEEEGVESGSYVIPNPYAATAGTHQRSLCNKCHAKDPV